MLPSSPGKLWATRINDVSRSEDSSIVASLKACAQKKDLCKGIRLHSDIVEKGFLAKSPYVASTLISMYAKCGMLNKAREVLEELSVRSVYSWNALIAGYAQDGKGCDALDCFQRMQSEGFSPNTISLLCTLKACGSTKALDQGKRIHDQVINSGLWEKNIMLGTAVVDMYAKCGAITNAQQLHDKLYMRDVVSWSALISGYASQGLCDEALKCYDRMQDEGISPNSVTFICILKACGSKGAIARGKQIHEEILGRKLLENNLLLGTALIDMYVKCGALQKAEEVLKELHRRDVVSWNALITGYTEKESGWKALNCFEQMQSEGISPDIVTFACILKACGTIGAIDKGKRIHDEIISKGFLMKDAMIGNALVDMYVKCDMLEKAQEVLEGLRTRDVISWSALIAGYSQKGKGHEALSCFEQMQGEGISPNAVTFICTLKACGSTGTIDKGEEIHDEIINQGLLKKDIVLGNALVDMYAKCGAVAKAYEVLEGLPIRDVISWSSLIAGYAQKGQGYEALKCFHRMRGEGLVPDSVTFLCVLNACNHSGLLNEAQTCFGHMNRDYDIMPNIEHHIHMVLVFGCAGYFDEAMSLIKTMPCCDYATLWLALLDACKKLGNAKLGRVAFDHAVQLDDCCSPAYILMCNIYAASGMHEKTFFEMMGRQLICDHFLESQ